MASMTSTNEHESQGSAAAPSQGSAAPSQGSAAPSQYAVEVPSDESVEIIHSDKTIEIVDGTIGNVEIDQSSIRESVGSDDDVTHVSETEEIEDGGSNHIVVGGGENVGSEDVDTHVSETVVSEAATRVKPGITERKRKLGSAAAAFGASSKAAVGGNGEDASKAAIGASKAAVGGNGEDASKAAIGGEEDAGAVHVEEYLNLVEKLNDLDRMKEVLNKEKKDLVAKLKTNEPVVVKNSVVKSMLITEGLKAVIEED